MEVWLRSIGLGDRVTVFRDQGITLDQVTDLTDQDLRELGLTIGDRIRFRNAVKHSRRSLRPTLISPPRLAGTWRRSLRPCRPSAGHLP